MTLRETLVPLREALVPLKEALVPPKEPLVPLREAPVPRYSVFALFFNKMCLLKSFVPRYAIAR